MSRLEEIRETQRICLCSPPHCIPCFLIVAVDKAWIEGNDVGRKLREVAHKVALLEAKEFKVQAVSAMAHNEQGIRIRKQLEETIRQTDEAKASILIKLGEQRARAEKAEWERDCLREENERLKAKKPKKLYRHPKHRSGHGPGGW